MPIANASPTYQMRSGPGSPSSSSIFSRSFVISFMPSTPTSSPRSAFWNDSWNVRPIAITSPTDFICVVEVRVGRRELLEREARHLRDDVVDRRLETAQASRRR